MTVLKRKEDTKVGHIENVTFENINCRSENGIVIYAEETGLIRGLRLRNISLHLVNETSWPKGTLDVRPCTWEGLKEGQLHALTAYRARDVKIEDLRISADANCPLGENVYDIRECEDFTV